MIKSSNPELFVVLKQLTETFILEHQKKYNCLPQIDYQADWLSPCQIGQVVDDYIEWQPQEITDELSFDNIEQALELTLHPDIKTYFSCFYSESIPANCSEGYLELLFAWSKDDFSRLQENIVGHILMKQKLKQTETVFIAVTDDDNVIVSVDNNTGEVYAESIGKEPHKKLASSISEFLQSLEIAFE